MKLKTKLKPDDGQFETIFTPKLLRVQFPVRDGQKSQYVTSHPGQLSLTILLWVGEMSTSQRAVMSCN